MFLPCARIEEEDEDAKSRKESNGAKVCTAHSSNRTKYCCEIDVELNVNELSSEWMDTDNAIKYKEQLYETKIGEREREKIRKIRHLVLVRYIT